MTSSSSSTPPCKRLVLDAGPLLSLSPLRGLAETYVTVPQVLAELKDKRAREHFEKLALVTGVKVEIQAPDAASLNHGACWLSVTLWLILMVCYMWRGSHPVCKEDRRLLSSFAGRFGSSGIDLCP